MSSTSIEGDSPPLSRALLAIWRREAPRRRIGAIGAKGCVFTLVFLPIPIAALFFLVAPAIFPDDLGGRLGLGASFLMLASAIGILIAVLRVSRRPTRRLLKAIEKGQAREECPREADLDQAISQHAGLLGVARPRVFFLRTALFASPYVAAIDKKDALVIPAGFLGLWRSRPAEARAILAHEIAHIAQRDLSSWGLVGAANRVIGFLLVLKTLEYIAAVISAEAAGGGIAFLMGLLFFWRLRRTRAASECTADLAAAAVVSPDAIRSAISLFRTARLSVFGEHPSRKERLGRLDRFVNEAEIAAKRVGRMGEPPAADGGQ